MAVMVLRIKSPDTPRPFRVPGGPIIPALGVLSCLYLMISLSAMTWVRFLVWLDVGMLIYWFYGRIHSPLVDAAEAAARPAAESLGNLLKMVGYILLFNGGAVALLGVLTELGVTTETQIKWSELDALISRVGLHINPEIADRFGLTIFGAGLVLVGGGWALARSGRR
jgi:hypothetical protein